MVESCEPADTVGGTQHPQNSVDKQEVDSWRTHVTETQLQLAQEDLQEDEEVWEEQQARLKPTTPVQPGNKILRPAIDDAPFDEGFRFKQVKAFGVPPSKVPQSKGNAVKAADDPLQHSNTLGQHSGSSSNTGEGTDQIRPSKDSQAASQAVPQAREAEKPLSEFALPNYEGTLRSRAKYFDLTGPAKLTTTDKAGATEPSCKDRQVEATADSIEITQIRDGEPQTTDVHPSPRDPTETTQLGEDVHIDEASNATSRPNGSTRTTPQPLTRPIPRGDDEMRPPSQDNLHDRVDSARNKVTKRRDKNHLGSTTRSLAGGNADQPRQESVPNSEQLLKMFLFRRRKEEEEQHLNRSQLQQKGVQLQSMTKNVTSLQDSLQQAHRRCETQDAELSTYRQRLAKFKDKVANFQKYFDGLSRDHHKAQGDFKQLKIHLQDVVKAKYELESSIADERAHYQAVLNSQRKKLREARAEIMELEVRSLRQEQDFVNHNDLIDAEQQRNDMLEHEVSMISTKQAQMLTDMTTNQASLIERLATLPDLEAFNRAIVPIVSSESILARLQEVLHLLSELRNKPDSFLEEFQRFGREIKANAEVLTTSIQSQQHEQKSFQKLHSNAVECVGQQVDALCGGLQKEKELMQMIAALRETKVGLEERMERKTAEMTTLNSRCYDLEKQSQRKHTDVMILSEQLATLRARPEIDPALPERLRESERLRNEMQANLGRLQETLDDQQLEIQDRERHANSVQQQIEEIKLRLSESEASVANLQSEKESLKRDSKSSLDNLRAEFLKAAEIERSVLTKKHTEALYTIQNHRDSAEKRATAADEEVKKLNVESTSSRLEATDLKAQLQEAKNKITELESQLQVLKENSEANNTKSAELSSCLKTAEASNADLNGEVESLKQKLTKARGASAKVSELQNTLKKIGEEKKEAEQQVASLKAALTQTESQARGPSSYQNSCVQSASQIAIGSEPTNGEQTQDANLNGGAERLPPTNANIASLDKALGSLMPQNSGPELSEELPWFGKKYAFIGQSAIVEDSQELQYEQPLEALYEDIDLLMASDTVRHVPSQSTLNQDHRSNDTVVDRVEDSTAAELRRSGASPPRPREQSEREGETDASHANNTSANANRQTENVSSLRQSHLHFPSTPKQSSSRSQEFERRSNSSAKRTPPKLSQDPYTIQKAHTPHEDRSSLASNTNGQKSLIVPKTVDRSISQSGRHTVNGNRKRLLGEADQEVEINPRNKLNKFTKTVKDTSQSSVDSPTKKGSLSKQEAARRGKSRVSRGEIRSLGPIIGGPHSPSKTATSAQDEGNKKKTRKSSGVLGNPQQDIFPAHTK